MLVDPTWCGVCWLVCGLSGFFWQIVCPVRCFPDGYFRMVFDVLDQGVCAFRYVDSPRTEIAPLGVFLGSWDFFQWGRI